jgi:hypothetical protein
VMEVEDSSRSLAEELGDILVRHATQMEEKLRNKVEAENELKVAQSVDEELAFYAPHLFGKNAEEASGLLSLENDHSLAARAQFLMSESWQPLSVQADSRGKVNGYAVEVAMLEFLAGAPLSRDLVGSDQQSAILLGVMQSCEQKYQIDPHAKSIIDNKTNFTMGGGIDFNCTDRDVDDTLRVFAKNNGLPRRSKEAVRRLFKFGEHYFFYFIDQSTGDIYIRDKTKPTDIKAILTHPEDSETRLAYGRSIGGVQDPRVTGERNSKYEWFADVNYYEQKERNNGVSAKGTGRLSRQKLVQMIRIGDSSETRGTPILYPALRYLRYYEDFILDRIVLNHERSKVVWVRKVSGNRNIPGGRAQRGPVGGQILTETPQIEWKVINPEIHGDDATPDGRLIRMAIAAAVNMPEHILFQDPSQQVYASIRSSETPFSYNIRSSQQDILEDFQVMFRTVIREKVKARKLKPETEVEVFTTESYSRLSTEVKSMIRENAPRHEVLSVIEAIADESPKEKVKINTVDIQVDVKLPDVVQTDALKLAQETEILDRVAILSKTELAARHGGNYKRTALLKSIENEWVDSEDDTADGGKHDADVKRNQGRTSFGKKSDSPTDKPDKDDE